MPSIFSRPSNSPCPPLFLAPMEGVGDRPFRKAMATVGGFDEAVTEFIRVPTGAHVESLAKVYQADELAPIPLAAQVMGSDPEGVGAMGIALENRDAPRIDLNCGCPSKIVTGKGAGSSLLKNPSDLYAVASALVKATSGPVTLKMRSGFDDTGLFKENLEAAEASGVAFITLHPRTKKDGYSHKADWSLIAQAKQILKIPLVGNGDILSVEDAIRMHAQTGCDGLMIGRGSVQDPFIFQKIRAHFEGTSFVPSWDEYLLFFHTFLNELGNAISTRTKINKLKQLVNFLFLASPSLLETKKELLCLEVQAPEAFLEALLAALKKHHF